MNVCLLCMYGDVQCSSSITCGLQDVRCPRRLPHGAGLHFITIVVYRPDSSSISSAFFTHLMMSSSALPPFPHWSSFLVTSNSTSNREFLYQSGHVYQRVLIRIQPLWSCIKWNKELLIIWSSKRRTSTNWMKFDGVSCWLTDANQSDSSRYSRYNAMITSEIVKL